MGPVRVKNVSSLFAYVVYLSTREYKCMNTKMDGRGLESDQVEHNESHL